MVTISNKISISTLLKLIKISVTLNKSKLKEKMCIFKDFREYWLVKMVDLQV